MGPWVGGHAAARAAIAALESLPFLGTGTTRSWNLGHCGILPPWTGKLRAPKLPFPSRPRYLDGGAFPLGDTGGPIARVGAFEAKNKLGQLLDLVEQSEEVIVTRQGREVARLVPVRPIHSREQARAAIRRIRERAEQSKLGAFDCSEWKSHRDEGRAWVALWAVPRRRRRCSYYSRGRAGDTSGPFASRARSWKQRQN
jgi:prevent-host-death family protein